MVMNCLVGINKRKYTCQSSNDLKNKTSSNHFPASVKSFLVHHGTVLRSMKELVFVKIARASITSFCLEIMGETVRIVTIMA